MKSKKLFVIIISVVFSVIVICSVFATFTLRKVNVSFCTYYHSYETGKINEKANSFCGKNLLFFDESEIKKSIEENPYMQVTSIEKQYPSTVSVSVTERKEVYLVSYADKKYVTDKDGFVLSEIIGLSEIKVPIITLSLDGINVLSINIGEYLVTDDEALIKEVFSICESVNLTDCINALSVRKYYDGEDHFELNFKTNTNVVIAVNKAEFKGKQKTQDAFSVYDNETSDYRKSNNKITVYNYDKSEKGYEIVWES